MMAAEGPNIDADAAARRQEARIEAQREREFYRYWEPVRQLSRIDPARCDPSQPEEFEKHVPRSSPDTALTAFCQLAALRFNAKRSMLFFFDTSSSYVLAEATQSLSLQDDARHESEDSLWLGFAVVPRGNSICEHTVKMPLSRPEDSEIGSQVPINIVPNLQNDAKFCGLPLVTGRPKCQFYAGVPVVTAKGINIGAFCVLDDTPREGIAEKDATFLRDMSATISTHLEIVRSKREHQRGTQMIQGLGAFVQGCSDLRDWHHNVKSRKHTDGAVAVLRSSKSSNSLRQRKDSIPQQSPPVPGLSTTPPGEPEPHPDTQDMSLDITQQTSRPNEILARANSAPESASVSSDLSPSSSVPQSGEQVPYRPHSRHNAIGKDTTNPQNPPVSSDIKSTYQRAAELLRAATEAHGVAFLDASIGTFGGLVESMHTLDDTDPSTTATETDSAENDDDPLAPPENEAQPPKQCCVLGSALSSASREGQQHSQISVTERFLKSILRRYPKGMIWNFDQNGLASSEDELSSGNSSDKASGPSSRPNASSQGPRENTARSKRKRKRSRIEDARLIQEHFPGIRSIGMHGLWDQAKGRWYAACVIWTYSPLRIFSISSEMNYVAAFCDVIMAETRRLEIQRIDSAKSSVLASVSHELRSPLHGILGSTEVLQDQPIDDLSLSLVTQIESCGRTLLDIIDHLLDLSDINHFVSRDNKSGRNDRRRVSAGSSHRSQMGSMMSLDVDIALDEITEEVVEAAVYSFYCRKPLGESDQVTTVLDIDRPSQGSWRCRIAAGGWRRIVMNLVTNALKYTSKGQIYVGLKAEVVKSPRKRECVVLTVVDSGQGMSKAFLEEGLYKAFSQEDTLVEGMGLGMSMVAKITQAFGGTIEVQSDQSGGGTRVLITLPIERSRVRQETGHEDFSGSRIGIITTAETTTKGKGRISHGVTQPTLLNTVAKSCRRQGLEVRHVATLDDTSVQLSVVTEKDLGALSRESPDQDTLIKIPLIVICNSVLSERALRKYLPGSLVGRKVEYVSQPCGPLRLRAAIASCLGKRSLDGESGDPVNHSQDAVAPPDAEALDGQAKTEGVETAAPQTKVPEHRDDAASQSPHWRPLASKTQSNPLPESVSENPEPTSTIPPQPESAKPTQLAHRPPLTSSISQPRASGINLLLVDDNHINLSLLQTYARKNGHEAVTATDGAQAVAAYRTAYLAVPPAVPHVVLMDINMPVLNGFEATQQIRAYERAHGLKPATIIALTGLGSADAQKEAFGSGLDLFLTKPVRLKELGRVIDGLREKGVL